LNLEHVIWTTALCILVGMFYEKYTNRNPVWIIWFAVMIPDVDFVLQTIWEGIFPMKITPIIHGDFHNIFVLILVSLIVGWYIWKNTKVWFKDAVFCVALGFIAHLVEDALVNGTKYHFYRPFSDYGWYQGFILKPMNDIIVVHTVVASTNVVFIGLLLVALAILIRSFFMGDAWLEKYNFMPSLKRSVKELITITPIKIMGILAFYGLMEG